MKTWKEVEVELNEWLANGQKGPVAVVKLANECVGWPYVFGAWGEECNPSNRKRRMRDDHPTIKSACQVLSGKKDSCSGCKWYPGGETVRMFDCRGFTDFVLNRGAGIDIKGEGATSQWNESSNWSEKGTIDKMPKDKVCCAFRYNSSTGKMEHTLLYDGQGNYIDCSSGVQKRAISKYKATHYAIPKGLYNGGDTPVPTPEKDKAIITGKNVALREGPSTSNKIITRIPTNTIVDIAKENDEWQLISYKGKVGYMMKAYIKEGQ